MIKERMRAVLVSIKHEKQGEIDKQNLNGCPKLMLLKVE